MMDRKQKYVRLGTYDEIIIFSSIINHSEFKDFNPISAGFCYIGVDSVDCYGHSISLNIGCKEDDSYKATKQIFGYDAADKILTNK